MKNVDKRFDLKKYTLRSKIIELFNVGDNAIFQINKYRLHCFIPNFTNYGFAESWDKYGGSNIKGKTIKVYLQLSVTNLELIKSSNQKLTKLSGFRHQVVGKIIGKLNIGAPDEKLIVKCGIPIIINPPNKPEYKKYEIGDWVESAGRLDMYKVENRGD